MKHNLISVFFLCFSFISIAQEMENRAKVSPNAVETLSGIVSSAYKGISGEAGSSRELKKLKELYAPNAVIFKNSSVDGKLSRQVLTVEEFFSGMNDLRESGFFEEEINREARIFGNIAQVWSTYQIRHEKNGPIIRRGINSMQLHFDENRWWIVAWGWDGESAENRIPASFDSH
ncbi:MAG: hypothetical protein AAGD88_10480 [Bacteroidota bacterium]